LEDLWHNRRGNIALTFALLAPLLLAFVGAGVDYAPFSALKTELQEIADAGVIAGARQYLIRKDGDKLPVAIAEAATKAALGQAGLASLAQYSLAANDSETSVEVSIVYPMKPTFLTGLFESAIDISVFAKAQANGSANICVIGLDPSAVSTVKLSDSAKITGNDCAVFFQLDKHERASGDQNVANRQRIDVHVRRL
jgi:uncharacterized membrane protein